VLYSLDKPLAIAIIAGSVWITVTFIIDPRDHPRGHHPELKGVEQRHRQLRPAGCQVGDQDPDLGRITAAASRA
jgi:hypothetical protein